MHSVNAPADDPLRVTRRRGRKDTEAALIAAFDRVVGRGGLRSVGVNEVIKEAGVGKALLYRYFGGLPGLVKAWGDTRRIWPDIQALHRLSEDHMSGDPAAFVKDLVKFHAAALRENPLRVELLAEQLMQPSPISEVLEEIRKQLAAQYHEAFEENESFLKHRELIRFMLGSVSYMAMRSAKAPHFMGTDLSSSEGWEAIMRQFDAMVDASLAKSAA